MSALFRSALVAALLASASVVSAELPTGSWPQFRGPAADGHAPQAKLPTRWSEAKNVRWKAPIDGLGWSSPAIDRGQIWLTTATDEAHSLRAICLDQDSGKIVHDIEVFHKDDPGGVHSKNSHASPTPLIDGDRVFVHFGAHGTACLGRSGKIIWKTEIPYYHHHGPSASPILVDGKLIIPCDGFTKPFYDDITRTGIDAPQFVIALDAANGKTVWKTPRDGNHSYCTPLAIKVNGKTQIVSPGGKRVTSYDLETGKEIWWCDYGDGYSVVPVPAYGNGLVYVCTGYDTPSLLAIRPDGTGDVTDSHIEWKTKPGVPLNPAPLLVGEKLFLVSDGGVMSCLEAKTGNLEWKGRLGGNFSAAPILVGDLIYACSETGVTHVIDSTASHFERIASSKLDGYVLATPAVVGDALYLRTDKSLYRIEGNDAAPDEKTPR